VETSIFNANGKGSRSDWSCSPFIDWFLLEHNCSSQFSKVVSAIPRPLTERSQKAGSGKRWRLINEFIKIKDFLGSSLKKNLRFPTVKLSKGLTSCYSENIKLVLNSQGGSN
jgi:hypothetical protein